MRLADLLDLFDPQCGPGLDLRDIDAFEQRIGYQLPEGVRQILRRANGGNLSAPVGAQWPSPLFSDGVAALSIERWFGIDGDPHASIRALSNHFADMQIEVAGVPADIFVIGDDWGGNVVTLNLGKAGYGRVGWVDHETIGERFDEPETYLEVASSIDEFVAMLHPLD